jgi:hypothetical protein
LHLRFFLRKSRSRVLHRLPLALYHAQTAQFLSSHLQRVILSVRSLLREEVFIRITHHKHSWLLKPLELDDQITPG